MRRSDSRPSLPLHFVILRLAVPVLAPAFARTRPDAGHAAWGLWVLAAPCQLRTGDGRVSQVPGEPSVPMPCSWTPVGPTHQALTMRRRGPRCLYDEGSRDDWLSGLDHTALALAVYASPGGFARTGRKTRFPLLARLYGTGLVTRRVPTKGFRHASYMFVLLPQALPGADRPPTGHLGASESLGPCTVS